MEIIFKDRIRALRQERGETQVQVAEAIGVAESHYQRFERGANLPNLENVWKLADHFGVTIDYLVGRWKTSGSWRTTSASPSTIWWDEATSGGNMRRAAGRRPRGSLLPQGACPAGCAPHSLFGCAKKRMRRARWKRKSASAGRSAPAQTSCRRRGMVGTPLQKSGTETHRPWGILRPGEVQGYPCFAFRCRSRFRGEPASA